jgi:hypothetical protein
VQAYGLRARCVERRAGWFGARRKPGDTAAEIIERDRLEALAALPWQKQNAREPGKSPHQGRAAVGAASDHERWLHDQPVRIELAKCNVGLRLRTRISGRHAGLRAHRRDMHDAAHAGRCCRLEQGDGRLRMDALRPVAQAPCKMPTQFTTTSMPARRGAQYACVTSLLKSQAIHSMSGLTRRASSRSRPQPMTVNPSRRSAATTSLPMKP